MNRNQPIHINIPDDVHIIINTLNIAGHEAYIVGGCVRDTLMGRVPKDWDINTSARPEQVKKLFHKTAPQTYGCPFGQPDIRN